MSSPTSSSSSSGIRWQLDPQTRRWFYIDSRTRQRVYHQQPQHQDPNAPRRGPAPPRELGPFQYRPPGPTGAPRSSLDQDYKVRAHPRKFFKIGKVFLTLHTEPRGSNSTLNTRNHDIFTVALGEQAFSKIRRFIVVREGRDSCSALAISTHSGNGASRRNASEHGIVYNAGTKPPQTMRQENGLLPTPIRIDPLNQDDRLDPTSRMDYGKLYNIEHNVKVKPYGVVNNQSMQTLIKQWTQVFFGRAATPAAIAFRTPNPQTLQALKFSPSQIRQVLNILSRRGADPRQVITSVARASAEEELGSKALADHAVELIVAGMDYNAAVAQTRLLQDRREEADEDDSGDESVDAQSSDEEEDDDDEEEEEDDEESSADSGSDED